MSYKEFSQRIDSRESKINFAVNRLNRARKGTLFEDYPQKLLRGQTKALFRQIDEIVHKRLTSDRELTKISSIDIGNLVVDFGESHEDRIDRLVDTGFYGFAHNESTLADAFPWKSTRYKIISKEAGLKLILRRSINDATDFREQSADTRISAELKTKRYKNRFKGNYNLKTQDYYVLSAALHYASECLSLLK